MLIFSWLICRNLQLLCLFIGYFIMFYLEFINMQCSMFNAQLRGCSVDEGRI